MIFVTFIISILDVAIITVLMCHGNKLDLFTEAWNDINYKESTLDLWYFSIIRFSFICGALIGLLHNKNKGQDELKKNFGVIVIFMVAMMIYGAAKLLIYSEQEAFRNGGPTLYWFWAIFIYSEVACVSPIILWYQLGTYEMKKPDNVVLVDVGVNENTPLLGNSHSINVEEEDSSNKKNTLKPDKEGPSNSEDTGSSSSDSSHDDKDEDKKGFTKVVNKATIGKILRYTKNDAWLIILGIVFLTGAAIAEVFIPLYTGKVISGIAIDRDTNKFIKNIMVMSLITVAASICAGLRGGLMMTAINRLNIRIKNTLFESVSKQEMAFYDKTKTGEIISRLTSDTQTMSTAIGLNFNVFLRSLVKAVGTIVFMFKLSWRLSIITFMGLPLVVIVSKLYGNYYKKLQTEVQDKLAKANEVAEEVCSSMKTVRSFANENDECERYNTNLMEVYKVQLKQAVAYAGFMWSNEISSLALITGTLGYGGHLVISNMMSADNLIAFILYQLNLGMCLQLIGQVYTGLMQALGAAEKVFRIIEREPEININAGEKEPDKMTGHVKFENVSFVYPSRPKNQVLKNVSFEAEPGQVTALVGPSGGGKSSCVNLLQHLYEPVEGSVSIDGINVKEFTHKYLHEKMTMVGQEPVLFSRTISENIAYGMPSAIITEHDVVQAAMDANAHSFITEMPDGYKTESGEKGTQLSGGQKQRVAIARALVRKPRILLLDEATSALDTQSEYLVQEALRQNFKDRTVLVIAHRLSTVEHANKIVVIDHGEVKEQGTHQELMENNGIYHKLVYRQLHRHHDLTSNNEKIKEIEEDKSQTKKKKKSKNIDISKSSVLSSSCESSSSFLSGSFKSYPGRASRASTMSRSSGTDSPDEMPNI